MRSKTNLRSQKHDMQTLMQFAVAGVKPSEKTERALPPIVSEAIKMFDGQLVLDAAAKGANDIL